MVANLTFGTCTRVTVVVLCVCQCVMYLCPCMCVYDCMHSATVLRTLQDNVYSEWMGDKEKGSVRHLCG